MFKNFTKFIHPSVTMTIPEPLGPVIATNVNINPTIDTPFEVEDHNITTNGESTGTTTTRIAIVNQSTDQPPMEQQQQHNIVRIGPPPQPVDTINNNITTNNMSWTTIANNDDNDMVRRWRESPYAVGLTHMTWADEKLTCCSLLQKFTPMTVSSVCCRCFGRVGNMVVIVQRYESYIDPITSSNTQRPKLWIVLGPYWIVLIFVTIPIFSLFSVYTAFSRIQNQDSIVLFILWLFSTSGLFISLLMVGCRDPGILYRHSVPPPNVTDDWSWNDQALTYRPGHAKYDPECAVVIEKFDHTCPWTGTAIGKNNIFWFRVFIVFVAFDIIFNASLILLF